MEIELGILEFIGIVTIVGFSFGFGLSVYKALSKRFSKKKNYHEKRAK